MKHFIYACIKEWLLMGLTVFLFTAALCLPLSWAAAAELTEEEKVLIHAFETGELIRLHIIANSDSEEDQFIKLRVRDALIAEFGQKIAAKATANYEQIYRFLEQRTNLMEQTAMECAQKYGFTGDVTAETGIFHLPEKQYGNILLPEGEYRALKITLGDGAGQNWWCVLFPSLCLSLSTTDANEHSSVRSSSARVFHNWLLFFQ